MEEARLLKKEQDDWTKLYHKTLQGLEAMIDVQRQVKDIIKMVEETNTTITEMEGVILKASIHNQMINMTHILGISEDLQNLVQSNMENWVYQIQRCLANELDDYKGKGNKYVDENIKEIQELYRDKNLKRKQGTIQDEEVVLFKPYKTTKSTTSKTMEMSFIQEEIKNLEQYVKFIQAPTKTKIFQLPPYYILLHSREEQDPDCWKEIATAFMEEKHNTETTRNGYPIMLYQGGLPHEPYFIAIDNHGRAIIRPNKKSVTIHIVGELEVLV